MITADDPRHGTNRGYAAGCHDLCCRRAHGRLMKRYRHQRAGLIDSTGTCRRIQALMFLGWRKADLANQLGIGSRAVGCYLEEVRVQRSTAAKVQRLYDRLSMTPGPSKVTAGRSRRLGYVGPLSWDDETIDDPQAKPYRPTVRALEAARTVVDEVLVQRALAGQKVEATAAERKAIIARWRAAGRPWKTLEATQGWKVHQGKSRRRQEAS